MEKDGWVKKKLGEVCVSDLGKTLNKSKDKGELHHYLCAINVLWDKIDFTTLKEARFSKEDLAKYVVKKGDLLICEGGDVGRAAIWEKEESFLYQNALHRVRFNGNLLPRFCLYNLSYLKSKGILDDKYAKGVTIKHLVKSSLLSIPISFPSLPEQQQIVSELDCLQGIIDKKKEQLQELDKLAQSIFYTMFGDPVENKKGWNISKLKDVSEIIGGSTPKTNIETYWNGSHYWVTPAEIGENRYITKTERTITDDALLHNKMQLLPIGTVLLSSRAPIGKVCITRVPMYCNQGFKNIVCSSSLINEYVYQYLHERVEYIQSLGNGATFKEISKKITENIPIPVPPLSLQQEFADKITAIEQQKARIQQSLQDTETLFNSRMDYYFG